MPTYSQSSVELNRDIAGERDLTSYYEVAIFIGQNWLNFGKFVCFNLL